MNTISTLVVTLDSPVIRVLQYDGHRKELQLLYTSGTTFCYTNVPRSTVVVLLRAKDMATVINSKLINCQSYQVF